MAGAPPSVLDKVGAIHLDPPAAGPATLTAE